MAKSIWWSFESQDAYSRTAFFVILLQSTTLHVMSKLRRKNRRLSQLKTSSLTRDTLSKNRLQVLGLCVYPIEAQSFSAASLQCLLTLLVMERSRETITALIRGFPPHCSEGYAMLMSSNRGETAVHGCHCQGDMVVCMRKVLAIPRSWYLCFSV